MPLNLSANALLSHYRIVSKLGAGGMGEVYLAEDTELERRVALKVLLPDLAGDDDRVRRFVQEAKAASALNHPNILTVYQIGHVEHSRFIATEWIQGQTLRERIGDESLSVLDALAIATHVAAALAAAHEAGIVHRDIKPENVMIREDGIAKVLDFGLAKLLEDPTGEGGDGTREMEITRAGTVLGTVAYMSPEQARGVSVDARSDLFSLGVVLFEMLAHRQPFTGETSSHIVVAILERDPPSLARLVPGLPSELETIVRRCLAKNVDARYQSANELLADLKALRRTLEYIAEFGRPPSATHPSGLATEPPPVSEEARERNSIAVLPFQNMSADPENEYFCDGLADELSNALAKIDELKVVARTSAFFFKGKDTSASAIGEALCVRTILEGSVRKSGNRVRVSVQLVNAADGYHIWSDRYDREMQDIFDVQDEITLAVVDVLKVKLLGGERAAALKRGTENAEAYQLYLNGRFHWNKRTGESLQTAVESYRQAIGLDPSYAMALAGLAECYVLFSWLSVSSPRESMPQAKEAALRAIEMDESVAEAHAALGVYLSFFEWNQLASEKALRRAIELKPNSASAVHWLGNVPLLAMGRFDESISAERRARELDPLSPIIMSDTGLSLFYARRFDEAIEQFQQVLVLDEGFYVARYHLGQVYHAKGMIEEAIREYEACLVTDDDPWVRALLGRSLAAAGRRAEAQMLSDRLRSESKQRYVPNVGPAVLCAALGDMDEAFRWLEKDIADRSLYPPFYGVDPVMDDFRGDARFDVMRRAVERGGASSGG